MIDSAISPRVYTCLLVLHGYAVYKTDREQVSGCNTWRVIGGGIETTSTRPHGGFLLSERESSGKEEEIGSIILSLKLAVKLPYSTQEKSPLLARYYTVGKCGEMQQLG